MRKIVNLWCLVSFVTLLVLAVPFMVQQVRWGIYPQLEPHVSFSGPGGGMDLAQEAPLEEAVQTAPVARSPVKKEMSRRMKAYLGSEAAEEKGIHSPVSGDVDVVVVPDLDAGNILSKNLEYLASAKMAGIVMGATVPVVLTSRSDPPRARVYSLALAGLLC